MIPRSALIEKSLSCFHYGMAAMIPVIGFFLAGAAFLRFREVVVGTNDRWNPARVSLYVGVLLALASVLLHALVAFIVCLKVVRSLANA